MEAYPDIRPVVVARSAAETFEVLEETVRRLRWDVVATEAPQGRGKPGTIEAVERTLVLGFYDDIVIRIDGDQRETRIDIRSASRYGQHDLGRNAARVRGFFKELQSRLEATVTPGTRGRACRGPALPCLSGRKADRRCRRALRNHKAALSQVLNVRRNRKRGRVQEPRIKPAINDRNDLRDSRVALADALQDRLLAHAPVQHVGFDDALGLRQAPAVTREIHLVGAVEQSFERADVVGHLALGRRHHARVPGHDVVAGEQDAGAFQCETQVIRRVPGCVQGRQSDARRVAGGHRRVSATSGAKSWSTNSPPEGLVRLVPRSRAVRPKPHVLAPVAASRRGEAVGVVAVRVRDQDMCVMRRAAERPA